MVSVADHGVGVPPEERTRIFEEFARVDRRPDASDRRVEVSIERFLEK